MISRTAFQFTFRTRFASSCSRYFAVALIWVSITWYHGSKLRPYGFCETTQTTISPWDINLRSRIYFETHPIHLGPIVPAWPQESLCYKDQYTIINFHRKRNDNTGCRLYLKPTQLLQYKYVIIYPWWTPTRRQVITSPEANHWILNLRKNIILIKVIQYKQFKKKRLRYRL